MAAGQKGDQCRCQIPSLVELFEEKFPRVARTTTPPSWGKPLIGA